MASRVYEEASQSGTGLSFMTTHNKRTTAKWNDGHSIKPHVDSSPPRHRQTTLQSRSLSGRHVSPGFLDPVLGAMMKQVCWHSRRSKAYRGLPEARMAGATVEETAFEDVNMWQAPVSQKPPLMGTQNVVGPRLGGET